ncbi:MAG: penicillin-binding protein 2 [Eggerthellaceae bacterium]|nr:penicillin-binding protein 2 [Eggerthellaceae bacterium]
MTRRFDNDSDTQARRTSGGRTSSDGRASTRLTGSQSTRSQSTRSQSTHTTSTRAAGTQGSRTNSTRLSGSQSTRTNSTRANGTGSASRSSSSRSSETMVERATRQSRWASILFNDSQVSSDTGMSNKLFRAFLILFAVVAILIAARLVYVQVVKGDEYRAEALATRTGTSELRATRGTIYDRRGNVLAISVPAVTIVADPTLVDNPVTTAGLLSVALDVDETWLLEELEYGKEHGSRWLYVKRAASLQEASAVKQLVEEKKLTGLLFYDTTRREYPYGEVGGQIIGLCNIDGEGVSGLEYFYDTILAAKPGTYQREIGNSGLPIPGAKGTYVPGENGQDIIISIDIELQKELEDALLRSAAQEGATSTSGVVLDASTGEILAIASLPLFNPADPDSSDIAHGATSIWGICSAYEPGSTFKTITATSLLEHDCMEPTDTVMAPIELHVDDKIITDSDPRDPMIMDLNWVIAASSNIGIDSCVIEYSNFETLYADILRYGFTEVTGVDYPGEAEGYLLDIEDENWTDTQAYNMAFGQGISVTALQMVQFYAALANGGYAFTPHFLLKNLATDESPDFGGKQLLEGNEELTDKISTVLRHVVSEGTGWIAGIKGFYVVGKSGTAEIWNGSYYRKDLYNRSFIGYLADASTPLVCYFCAQDVPYEGSVAPTFFKTIMQQAIERYRVTSKWDGQEKDAPGVHIPI